jgi:hypothetical protein
VLQSTRRAWPTPSAARLTALSPHTTPPPRSPEQREQLDALLEDIYEHWVDTLAAARGKTREVRSAFPRVGPTSRDLRRESPAPLAQLARLTTHPPAPRPPPQDVLALLDEGVYDMQRLADGGFDRGLTGGFGRRISPARAGAARGAFLALQTTDRRSHRPRAALTPAAPDLTRARTYPPPPRQAAG